MAKTTVNSNQDEILIPNSIADSIVISAWKKEDVAPLKMWFTYAACLFMAVQQCSYGLSVFEDMTEHRTNERLFDHLNPWTAVKNFFNFQFESSDTLTPQLKNLGFHNVGPIKVINKFDLLANFETKGTESDLSSKQHLNIMEIGPFKIINRYELLTLYSVKNNRESFTKTIILLVSKTLSVKVAALNLKVIIFKSFLSCVNQNLLQLITCGKTSTTTTTPTTTTLTTTTTTPTTTTPTTTTTTPTTTTTTSTTTTTTPTTTTTTPTTTTTTPTTTTTTPTTTTTRTAIVTEKKCDALTCPAGTSTVNITTQAEAQLYCTSTAKYCFTGIVGVFQSSDVVYTWPNGTTIIAPNGATDLWDGNQKKEGNHTCLVWVNVAGVWKLTNLQINSAQGQDFIAMTCKTTPPAAPRSFQIYIPMN